MRLIDADALTRKIQFLIRIRQRNIFDALDEIDSAPTINPGYQTAKDEIVRCKDCVYLSECFMPMCYCEVWKTIHGMGKDGFCGYGKRKEDENE